MKQELSFELSTVALGRMKISSAATLSVVSLALVALSDAWSCGPGGNGVFVRPTMPESMMPSVVRRRQREWMSRQQELWDQTNPRKSVRYQIFDTDKQFQVALDVPGVLAEDMDVAIEKDDTSSGGKILVISGEREKMGASGTYRVQFAQSFFLDDESTDVEQFSATLQNGVLVVTAPKIAPRFPERLRKIPIVTNIDDDDDDNVDHSSESTIMVSQQIDNVSSSSQEGPSNAISEDNEPEETNSKDAVGLRK